MLASTRSCTYLNLTAVSPLNGIAEIRGKDFVYLKDLQARQSLQTELKGFGPSSKGYDIGVDNRATGAGVRQTGDRPMSKINLWSPWTTVCPAPAGARSGEPMRSTSRSPAPSKSRSPRGARTSAHAPTGTSGR